MAPSAGNPSSRLTHTLIRASAGSGKTYQLTNRYLGLLAQGVSPDRILAVTFTRKAAGEIFDRIVLRLAQAAGSAAECGSLAGAIAEPDLTQYRCRELLVEITRMLHQLRVGTLDSFFNKIAGTCGMEIGLPLAWRIVEEIEDARLRDRAIAESLTGNPAELRTLLNMLSKGDASRGVSQLIRQAVEQAYALVRETDGSAWKKLTRYKGLGDSELDAICARLEALQFKDKRILKTWQEDCVSARAQNWRDLVRRGFALKILDGEGAYCSKPIDEETREIYEALIDHARSKILNQLADQTEATFGLLDRYRRCYERLQQVEGALRFDDITYRLARTAVADEHRTTFRLDASIDHLLLDEFQDTSLVQWRVLQPIAHRVATSRDGTSLFCVGDVKQAIYGWRGGLAELFEAVRQQWPHIEEKPLDVSWRSSQAVIDVVNRVCSRLHEHRHLEKYEEGVLRWQSQFNEHATAKKDLPGYVTLESSDREQESDEQESDDEFLDFVAQRIAETHERCPGATIGVLTRSNSRLGEIIHRLRGKGVPASEEGGNPLIDSCAVELILSLVRLADQPGDSASAYHLACSPLASELGLSKDEYCKTALLGERLRRELLEQGYGRTIYRWSQLLAGSCDTADRGRLQQLVELAYGYQPYSTLRPIDFLEYVEKAKVADPTTSPVRVMTVHQAKGLEFDVVFLTELDFSPFVGRVPTLVSSRTSVDGDIDRVSRYINDGLQKLLPKSFQEMFDKALVRQVGEALCVLYVELTRPIHALHMLIHRPKEGRPVPKSFAGFLRTALCDDKSPNMGVLFEHGDPNWHRAVKWPSVKVGAASLHSSESTPRVLLAPSIGGSQRGLDRESPSQLEGGREWRVKRAFELVDPERTAAMLRGTVIHACFEQVTWLDDGVPSDDAILAALARVRELGSLDEKRRRAWLNDFRQMLDLGDTPRVLSRKSYASTLPPDWSHLPAGKAQWQVRNELPFASIEEGRMLQGRMDRVVFLHQNGKRIAVEVIDFKTDVISDKPGERLADRVEYYQPQVEAYRRTLARQTGLAPQFISAALLFVGAGKLVRPKEEATQDA